MTIPRWLLHTAGIFLPKVRSNLAADAASLHRDAGHWREAARSFRRAVQIRPNRRSIWVQLGHALKEDGQLRDALDAYRRACALPDDGDDASLHHGVLAKQLGQFVEAKAALQQACLAMPDNASARSELLEIVHHPLAVGERAKMLAESALTAYARQLTTASDAETTMIAFDASDLISYFHHSRLPTGIQRVQMEVICNALQCNQAVRVCCFSDERGAWVRLPADVFDDLCALSIKSADTVDPKWVELIEVVTAILAEGPAVDFARGAFLVNVGTSWWMSNYFLHVRHAQREHGIHYVPFIHDFIPVILPEHCIRQLTQDFLGWALGVFRHADFYLVNSSSTEADLHHVGGVLGHTVVAEHVAVVPLDADFRRPGLEPSAVERLNAWNIAPQGFVLFVATIETRKNHRIAFLAWRRLIDRYGSDKVPDLVCVGNRGWLNDHVYAMLAADPMLAGKVRMLSRLSDRDLALLYQSCLFTLYPSLYEGWGLPVTESLSYGKVPLISNGSSLPEAGGDFAIQVDAQDVDALTGQLERLSFDSSARARLEARIASEFRPRQWSDIALQIQQEISKFVLMTGRSERQCALPAVDFDRLYRFRRNRQTRLAPGSGEGEELRFGLGWWRVEDWGCSIRQEGGELAFAVEKGQGEVRCFLRLRGPEGQAGAVTVKTGNRAFRVTLPAHHWQWLSVTAPNRDGEVRLTIEGHDVVDLAKRTMGHDRRRIGPGLGGAVFVSDPNIRSLAMLARHLAATASSAYAFLRDVYPILLNRDLDEAGLQDYLLPIERGGISMMQVVDSLMRSADVVSHVDTAAIFD